MPSLSVRNRCYRPAVPAPVVSVVVATYRRPALLPRLVDALERQTVDARSIQLVLVDDASPDDTPAVVADLAARTPLALTTLRLPRNGGPAAARNAGWAAATADVVAFTDDDCVPSPGWLAAGLAALDEGTVVAGRTIPDPAQLGQLGPFSRTIRAEDGRFVQTCNAFYRRADLVELDGFDGRMRTGEDTDLALRATERGRRVVYAPDALVHHDVRPSSLRATLRETLRWTDLPVVVRRHPQIRDTLLHRRIWWKASHPSAAAAIAGIATALVGRRMTPLALTLPWLRHRLLVAPIAPRPVDRLVTLPGAFAVDALEVAVMARASVEHRSVLL